MRDARPSVEESDVRVVAYDPAWKAAFEREAERLQAALGDYAEQIDHFGSTAVPGLTAKPIVDVLVGTRGADPPSPAHISALEHEGYESLGQDGRRPDRWFFRKRATESFNLSIVPLGSDLWNDNIAVREFLRSHPDAAGEYSRVKREAAESAPDSLLRYQDLKRSFVDALRERARSWFGPPRAPGP